MILFDVFLRSEILHIETDDTIRYDFNHPDGYNIYRTSIYRSTTTTTCTLYGRAQSHSQKRKQHRCLSSTKWHCIYGNTGIKHLICVQSTCPQSLRDRWRAIDVVTITGTTEIIPWQEMDTRWLGSSFQEMLEPQYLSDVSVPSHSKLSRQSDAFPGPCVFPV